MRRVEFHDPEPIWLQWTELDSRDYEPLPRVRARRAARLVAWLHRPYARIRVSIRVVLTPERPR